MRERKAPTTTPGQAIALAQPLVATLDTSPAEQP